MTKSTTEKTGPALSIGMPVYNAEAFLEEAMASLLAQSFSDFELVIADNASTDRTADIIAHFAKADPRVRAIRHKENLGAGANFRFVFQQARSEYFMWAAGDDVWEPRWIETLLPLAQRRVCLAYGRLRTIDAHSRLLAHPADNRDFVFTGPRLLRRVRFFLMAGLNGKANPIYGLFHRDLITPDFLEIFGSKRRGADVLALYHLLASTEIVPAGEVYLRKRKHSQSEAIKETPKRLPLRKKLFRKSQLPDFLGLSSPLEKIFLLAVFPMAWLGIKAAKIHYLWLRAR